MFEPNNEYIDELITSFLSKGATSEEEKQLMKWIESDSSNRDYYEQMYRAWLSSAQNGQLDPGHEVKALQQIHKKAIESSVVERRLQARKSQKSIFPQNVLKYAAAIAFLIIGTYTITRYSMDQRRIESHVKEMTYEAHYGSRAYATLPDGTQVWLNSGSKLSVQPGYNLHEREVELRGEAYFHVETNPEKPFIVKAGELSIRATGTAFNVKAYPDEEQITTTLVEGIVFIEGTNEQEKEFKIQMKPNQSISYKRQAIAENTATRKDTSIDPDAEKHAEKINQPQVSLPSAISHVKTEAITSWMKERWIIDNEEFGTLATLLERRYNVEIRFESDELKQYRFTGTIERETVEQMFDAFRYSIPLKYVIDKGIVTLLVDKELQKNYEKAWK